MVMPTVHGIETAAGTSPHIFFPLSQYLLKYVLRGLLAAGNY